jgi:N-acetylglucosamine-6-sulfatase
MARGACGRKRYLAAVIVMSIAIAVGAPGSLRPDAAHRAEAAQRPPPDVILVLTDDQRAGTLSQMPQLRRRVMRRGVRFSAAYVPNPSCCPSRASFYTGTYSHTNGVWTNKSPFGGIAAFDDSSTLATWLDNAGYRTGLFGKYLNGYVDPTMRPPGWDEWFAFLAGDERTYYGFDVGHDGALESFPESVYSTVETYRRVADFIRETPPGEPLFAVWTPLAPHGPYIPEDIYADAPIDLDGWRPPNYNERDVTDKPRWVRRTPRLDAQQRATLDADRIDQYRTLLSVDDGIAEIAQALREAGRLSNTLFIVASDNGTMWGEHRLRKKAVPYDGASRVPLLIRFDPLTRERRGTNVGSPVVNIDVAPTVMDLLGTAPGSPVDGTSLVPLLRGSAARVRTRFIIEHAGGDAPPYCGARTRRELFVHYSTGEEEYYRRADDPWNLVNAIDDPSNARRVRRLRTYAREECRPVPPGFTWST